MTGEKRSGISLMIWDDGVGNSFHAMRIDIDAHRPIARLSSLILGIKASHTSPFHQHTGLEFPGEYQSRVCLLTY